MIVDLTHVISQSMPVFPGTKKPILKEANTLKKDGFKETLINMYSHVGTHTDAPAHIIEGGKSLEMYDISYFCGRGVKIDCSHLKKGDVIEMEHIKNYYDDIKKADYIIFYTGWDRYWNEEQYFDGFPYPSNEVVEFLASSDIRGIGLDVISLDPIDDTKLTNHFTVLKKDMIIIENLTNLQQTKRTFDFMVMPLKYKDADGAPSRVIAII